MEHPKVDVFALTAYPHAHWTRIWSPSSREIRRRERVGSSANRPPSSCLSVPSWPTCTTNGKPATAEPVGQQA
jgi:hypothetical protein